MKRMFKYIMFFNVHLDCTEKNSECLLFKYVTCNVVQTVFKKNDYSLSNELTFRGICHHAINFQTILVIFCNS